MARPDFWYQMSKHFRFERPDDLEILQQNKLSVAVVISCRGGQDKLDLTLASLAAQSYPSKLTSVYIVDDGSEPALVLPKIRPAKVKLINYKNDPKKWGKTKATNAVTSGLKEDVIWFVDADMVFDPDHLAHHMKWHHDADDYAVLGWKRFVKEWSYTPAQLKKSLDADEFLDLHEENWGKERWEERSDRTNDLQNPGMEGFRNFVGATFSMFNKRWKELGGYKPDLITGEDTELGWRVQNSGLRMVADRQAHSWHLGYSTVEENKEEISRHNNPALAQLIPEMKSIRANSKERFQVSNYEVVLDVRNCTLDRLEKLEAELLEVAGTQAEFLLLANWSDLKKRYTPVKDSYADLREIHSWLKGSPQYKFKNVAADAQIRIEEILELFTPSAIPFHIFAEAEFELNLKDLINHALAHEYGLLGLANNQDRRAFVLINPALARARRTKGDTYANIAEQFGLHWMTYEKFLEVYDGKRSIVARFTRFVKREGKKVNSPKQLALFVGKILKLVKRKVLK